MVGRRVILNAAAPASVLPDDPRARPSRQSTNCSASTTTAGTSCSTPRRASPRGRRRPDRGGGVRAHLPHRVDAAAELRPAKRRHRHRGGRDRGDEDREHLGCPVTVTSRHAWKLEKAQQLGADHAVLDKGGLVGDARRSPTAAGSMWRSTPSARPRTCGASSPSRGGAYVTCGATSGPDATTDLARLLEPTRILGSTMGSPTSSRDRRALPRRQTALVADSIHLWENARRGRLEAGDQFGNVVLTWK